MSESNTGAVGRRTPPTCSRLGDAILPEIVATMIECTTCGSLPSDLKREAHPRCVSVHAMGSLWKVNCVCMVCGHFVVGKTAGQAIDGWNNRKAPSGYYALPDDCSDMESPENVKEQATLGNHGGQLETPNEIES